MTVERTKPALPRKQKPRSNTLVVDLKDLKAPWTAWCKSQNLTPSEAVRRILTEIISVDRDGEGAAVEAGRPSPALIRKRLEFRVSLDEYSLISSAAASEGMSVPRWINALLSLHLTKRVQFGQAEVEALVRSNQALLAIGRGLNQQIRERSGSTAGGDVNLAQLLFLSDLIGGHTKEVSKLLDANARRWRP